MEERGNSLKKAVGLTPRELIELPQGTIGIAVLPLDEGDQPAAIVITVDAGFNGDKLADVLNRALKAGEQNGGKVSKEEFKGLTLSTLQPAKPKEPKEDQPEPPPLIWTRDGAQFTIGTDAAAVKDVLTHAAGRGENALAASESFGTALKKLGPDGQIVWYADVPKFINLIVKSQAKGKNAANAEQFKAMTQVLGIGGLKAAGGTVKLNNGPFDSLTKTFVVAPAPLQGVLKLFGPAPRRPEARGVGAGDGRQLSDRGAGTSTPRSSR